MLHNGVVLCPFLCLCLCACLCPFLLLFLCLFFVSLFVTGQSGGPVLHEVAADELDGELDALASSLLALYPAVVSTTKRHARHIS